jgi:hypothetical protein
MFCIILTINTDSLPKEHVQLGVSSDGGVFCELEAEVLCKI